MILIYVYAGFWKQSLSRVFHNMNNDNLIDIVIGTGPAMNNDTVSPSGLFILKIQEMQIILFSP
ncbi:MAG: hypothetical protein R2771_10340 [Saprospiraceae bacterium]